VGLGALTSFVSAPAAVLRTYFEEWSVRHSSNATDSALLTSVGPAIGPTLPSPFEPCLSGSSAECVVSRLRMALDSVGMGCVHGGDVSVTARDWDSWCSGCIVAARSLLTGGRVQRVKEHRCVLVTSICHRVYIVAVRLQIDDRSMSIASRCNILNDAACVRSGNEVNISRATGGRSNSQVS